MDTTNLPKTRAEAVATKATHYFTGEPCKHGHIAPRKTKGACIDCLKVEWQKASETRADYFKAYNKSEAGQEAKQAYYAKNRTTVIARAQARPAEEKRAYKTSYKKNNPELYRALTSFRRRRFRDATPTWLTHRQKSEMRELYKIAATTSALIGEPYVVDHVIPLNGETVCGLHVPWNLRILTQADNLRKSNTLPDDTEAIAFPPKK